MNSSNLKCAGSAMQNCENKDITMIDASGFVYCKKHGEIRKSYMPVLNLSKSDIKNLKNGIPLKGKFK